MAAYIIKPEAIDHRHVIREIIAASGLCKVGYKVGQLLPEHVRLVYEGLPDHIIEASIAFLCNGKCEVGIVMGEIAFEKLTAVTGRYTEPAKCAPNTIRWKFGQHLPDRSRGIFYYKNAIHRTQDKDEFDRVLKVYEAMI